MWVLLICPNHAGSRPAPKKTAKAKAKAKVAAGSGVTTVEPETIADIKQTLSCLPCIPCMVPLRVRILGNSIRSSFCFLNCHIYVDPLRYHDQKGAFHHHRLLEFAQGASFADDHWQLQGPDSGAILGTLWGGASCHGSIGRQNQISPFHGLGRAAGRLRA